jgi:hypothetical protein
MLGIRGANCVTKNYVDKVNHFRASSLKVETVIGENLCVI